jgi:hypothetical protein
MAVGKEAKEMSLGCQLGSDKRVGGGVGGEGAGGGMAGWIHPPSLNPWEVTTKRRMKTRKRGR